MITAALIILTTGSLLFVLLPLFRPEPLPAVSHGGLDERAGGLQRQKEEVFSALQDLEFEFRMGKLTPEDFSELREEYKAKGISTMKEMDSAPPEEIWEEAIEKEIQALRRKGGSPAESGSALSPAPRACPACGGAVLPHHRFCSQCGSALGEACPACGTSYFLSARFCPACGKKRGEERPT